MRPQIRRPTQCVEKTIRHVVPPFPASSSASAAMAAPSSSSLFPRLPSAEGPKAGEYPSPSGRHSSASSGASPVSVTGRHGELLQEGGTSPPPIPVVPPEASEEDFQGAMMLVSS